MASLKYRRLTPIAVDTVMCPVAASQTFKHDSGQFVYRDSSGHITRAVTATTTLYGWVDSVPTGLGSGVAAGVWTSSATAGKDKLPVVVFDLNPGCKFLAPADDTVTIGMIGLLCDLIGANNGTAQQVDVGTSSTDVLKIMGIGTEVEGGAATDAIVIVNPAKTQAD